MIYPTERHKTDCACKKCMHLNVSSVVQRWLLDNEIHTGINQCSSFFLISLYYIQDCCHMVNGRIGSSISDVFLSRITSLPHPGLQAFPASPGTILFKSKVPLFRVEPSTSWFTVHTQTDWAIHPDRRTALFLLRVFAPQLNHNLLCLLYFLTLKYTKDWTTNLQHRSPHLITLSYLSWKSHVFRFYVVIDYWNCAAATSTHTLHHRQTSQQMKDD